MASLITPDISMASANLHTKLLLVYLQPRWGVCWSIFFFILSGTGLKAATKNNIVPIAENPVLSSQLISQQQQIAEKEGRFLQSETNLQSNSAQLYYKLKPESFLIAAPDNFSPRLRYQEVPRNLSAAPDNLVPNQQVQSPPTPT